MKFSEPNWLLFDLNGGFMRTAVSFPFFQTPFVRLDMVVDALPILLLSSVSRDSVSEIADPR